MADAPKHLFIGGNARSGTTALLDLLNCHKRVLVFMEANLNAFLNKRFDASLLSDEAVAKMVELPRFLSALRVGGARNRLGKLSYLGDKFPAIYRNFEQLDQAFPEATVLYIVRNPFSVVASYEARMANGGDWNRDADKGIEEWNQSVAYGVERAKSSANFKVIGYEDLFGAPNAVVRLFKLLGLAPREVNKLRIAKLMAEAEVLNAKAEPRNEPLRRLVALSADFSAYRELMKFNVLANDAGAPVKKPKVRNQKKQEV